MRAARAPQQELAQELQLHEVMLGVMDKGGAVSWHPLVVMLAVGVAV